MKTKIKRAIAGSEDFSTRSWPDERSASDKAEHGDVERPHRPIQYKKGYVEFYKLKFKITPDTLIPRPETELLVDEVLKFCNLYPETCNLILDLGTGSGNIAISLTKNLRGHPWSGRLKIIATDVSPQALKVAKQNAQLHGVKDRITFLPGDLLNFDHFDVRSHTILINPDIIVTNLPYIPTNRIPYLDPSVKDFEPHIALDGGQDGFELYRKLFAQIQEKGWKPKLILGEIDYTHGELAVREAQKLVVSEAEPYFPDYQVEVKTDLAHKQRILKITAPVDQTM